MSQYNTITIGLGERSYPLIIGSGLLDDSKRILEVVTPLQPSKIVVITNPTVQRLFARKLECLADNYPLLTMTIGDGERYKNYESLQQIYNFLLTHNCGRDIVICALGGGVVGDIAGFAAATYQRGVSYIQIPTTLLSQVDSSVGGKTAINHPLGKNMIGAFYQPKAVLIDSSTLTTLPARELSAGLAEVIKYSLICDPDFFQWLEENSDGLLAKHADTIDQAIAISCRHKAAIVEEDEQEQGSRALLNLGHTFGHAIERHTGYCQWLHGEAVAAGMVCAAKVSTRKGYLPGDQRDRIVSLLNTMQLPVDIPVDLDVETMLSLMELDKKNRNNQLRLILMQSIGDSFITDDIQSNELRTLLSP